MRSPILPSAEAAARCPLWLLQCVWGGGSGGRGNGGVQDMHSRMQQVKTHLFQSINTISLKCQGTAILNVHFVNLWNKSTVSPPPQFYHSRYLGGWPVDLWPTFK